ncbi:GAF domain-containing sensor histidine kinase [Limnoraphis robusta]|uniref:histidine kinase n=1 Tax=Limnoraphis robusta CS-951 TaxID=1637645 RepID=A0A0F5YEH0_9CYAN|nr:GAF domain-containing protein [Limnoraphis robusta]KKD36615.1 histidine kinase [Limnoraphis robusta CS-951]
MNIPKAQTVKINLKQDSVLHRITNRIRQSLKLSDILTATAAEVRLLLGTDRVKIYKFHPDGSGQVVAESILENRLPSLLGLNFPAGDIPPHARELFIKSRVRSVINTETQEIGHSHFEELDHQVTDGEDIRYRPLDPCHLEYLTAMGVKSSVAVPIINQEHLWGLLVSHHSESRTIPDGELQLLQTVVDQLSVAIAHSKLLTQAEERANRQACINRINDFLHSSSNIELQPALEEMIATLQGSGGRLCIKANPFNVKEGTVKSFGECLKIGSVEVYTDGKQPEIPELALYSLMEQYSVWQEHYQSGDYEIWAISDLFKEDALRNLQAAFYNTKIRSLLMIPLHYRQQLLGYLTIFRDEFQTEKLWAGRVEDDKRQLYPQISFEVWRDQKRVEPPKWAANELKLAMELGNQFSSAIYQDQMRQQLQVLNASLELKVQERTLKVEETANNLRQVTEQQRVLFDVVVKMRNSLNLETIFRTTTKELCKSLKTERVSVYRFNSDWGGEFVGDYEFVDSEWSNLKIGVNTVWDDTYLQETQGGRYRNGETFVVNDVERAGLKNCHVDILHQFQIKAFVTAPIFVGQQLWGILAAYQHTCSRQWETSEVQFLSQVATQLGVAIQQGELLIQTRKQTLKLRQAAVESQRVAKQQKVLFDVVTKMRDSLNVQKIFQTTTQETGRILQADRVVVFQFNQDWSGEFIHNYEFVLPQWESLASLGITSWADSCLQETQGGRFSEGKMLVVNDINKAQYSPCYRENLEKFKVKSYLVAPIFVGRKLWGLLVAYQHSKVRRWQSLEVGFFSQVAAQLGVAIQQANLLVHTQSQTEQLTETLHQLQKTQTQLIQTEKMSSLGQLVAGVAHEINNPVNFIHGNLSPISEYAENLLTLISLYQKHCCQVDPEIVKYTEDVDIDFVAEDLPKILDSMTIGVDRIRQIVRSLQNFSRLDQSEVKAVNIHEGIESTLMILQHRLKASGDLTEIKVVKEYGDLPLIECYPGQLNQVFMNLLSNAIDAVRDKKKQKYIQNQQAAEGMIRICTERLMNERVIIRIIDNGIGMSEAVKNRIFDSFFTTKALGKGTGLGLSISYQVVAEQHKGELKCHSTVGEGTEFCIEIPVHQ